MTLVPRHHVPRPSTILYGKAGKALFGAMESRRKFHIYRGMYFREYVSELSSVDFDDLCHKENIWTSIVFHDYHQILSSPLGLSPSPLCDLPRVKE